MKLTDKLTPHFTVGEFFVTNQAGGQEKLWEEFNALDAKLKTDYMENLRNLAKALEGVRKQLGDRVITISSGWRSKRVNVLVEGVSNSYHLTGMAADINVKGLTPKQVQDMLAIYWQGGMGLNAHFSHLDIRPKKTRFAY